ncbi:MAG: methyltransferase domain-containing protein [candidate division Zixibacteria bacterium]|nr:methyltransferase domain-containing protein [candidate division Zixibacteria bacterium]
MEIGAGFGDDTIDLAAKSVGTISVVPNMTNALIADNHLHEKELTNMKVAVMEDITRLPLANGSIAAIAMEDATAPGFKVTDRNFPAIAAEWARVLSPGGTVFLGLSNRYDRLFRFHSIRSIIQSHDHPESLNRFVKKATAPWPHSNLRLGQTIRSMIQSGFGEPTVYAPFPDEKKTEVVIPLEDARAVRYFLNNLIRKNSIMVRLTIAAANAFVALSLFRYIIPYYFLVFHLDDKSDTI